MFTYRDSLTIDCKATLRLTRLRRLSKNQSPEAKRKTNWTSYLMDY